MGEKIRRIGTLIFVKKYATGVVCAMCVLYKVCYLCILYLLCKMCRVHKI